MTRDLIIGMAGSGGDGIVSAGESLISACAAEGYHAIMSVVLLPLWILSGAVFPVEPTHGVLRWAARVNPIRYAVDAVRGSLAGAPAGDVLPGLAVLAGLTALGLVFAARVTRR